MSVVSDELNYQPISLTHSSHVLTKITPQQPLSTVESIPETGGTESIFEISGGKVINFGKSYLSYSSTPDGASTGATETLWRHLVPEITQLQLYTRNGTYLCDIPDFQTYWSNIARKETSYENMMNNDVVGAGSGFFNWLHKTYVLPAASTAGSHAKRPNGANVKVPYHEAQSLIHGTIDTTTGTNDNTPVLNSNLSFHIPNTIFMNKNQYFGESVFLRIVWSKATDVLFKSVGSNSDYNPTTGTAAYDGHIVVGSDITSFHPRK